MNLPVLTGAIYAFLAVALGAFGAHGLKEAVTPERLEVFNTGVEYHFYHALALILIGCLPTHQWLNRATILFNFGIVIFSGSLYLLVILDISKFGMITPIGGVCFMIGWVFMAIGATSIKPKE